jgi:hypothetical protein
MSTWKRCAICGLGVDKGAVEVCPSHRYVIHVSTLTAGEIAKVHAAGTYRPRLAPDRPVEVAVLELDTGDAFRLDPGAFREIGTADAAILGAAKEAVAKVFTRVEEIARMNRSTPEHACLLFRAALAAVSRGLAPKEPPPDVG